MSVRKRTWQSGGVTRTRWIHDFIHPVTGERVQEVIRDHHNKPVTSKAAAERIAAMQYAAAVEVASGRGSESADAIVTLEELLTYYRTRAGVSESSRRIDRVQSEHLMRIMGSGITVSMITLEALEQYAVRRMDENTGEFTRKKVSGATVKKEIALFRSAMKYAINRGKLSLPIPIMPEIVTEGYIPRWLSRDELDAFLEACGDDDSELRQVVEVTYLTGLRRAEIYRLTWDEVDLKHQSIRFRTEKRGGSSQKPVTTVFLAPRAVFLLKRRLAQVKSQKPQKRALNLVFGVPPYKVDGVETTVDPRITTKMRSAARRAGLAKPRQIGMHMLRHTCASHMLEAGATIPEVASHLRHRDGGALLLRTYAHVHEGGLRRVLDSFATKPQQD